MPESPEEDREERTEMKSIDTFIFTGEEGIADKMSDHINFLVSKAYNQGITEGIAEGRRVERLEMRCETCLNFEHDNFCKKGVEGWSGRVIPDFGCRYHERRKE